MTVNKAASIRGLRLHLHYKDTFVRWRYTENKVRAVMPRVLLITFLFLFFQGCASHYDAESIVKEMYNSVETGESRFDGTKYIRVSHMMCQDSVALELYQDSGQAEKGVVLVNAGTSSISNIDDGESLFLRVDDQRFSFSSFDPTTDYDEFQFPYGATVPFSHKSYILDESLIRSIASSDFVVARIKKLNNTYVEGICTPLTMKEYNSSQGKRFGDVSQKNLDIGNMGAAIYGFRKFVELLDQTQW